MQKFKKSKFYYRVILGTIMLSIFLMPVSIGINTTLEDKVSLKIRMNEALATVNISSIVAVNISNTSASFNVTLLNTEEGYDPDGMTAILKIASSQTQVNTQLYAITENTQLQNIAVSFGSLTPSTVYQLDLSLIKNNFVVHKTQSFATSADGNSNGTTTSTPTGTTVSSPASTSTSSSYLDCNLFYRFTDCVLGLFYMIWEASAWIARVAGGFLDFFVFYSIDTASYKNNFIEKGWGVVRDIANIFFIVALLYVALKTVLSLNTGNNKKMVGTIIIIALIINFSLFTTKVVIDASNILAKIFYNNITPIDKDGKKLDPNEGGEKSISVGMVSKFNPQDIVKKEIYDSQGGGGTLFFVIIMALIVTLYTAYLFFSVALLFVARVVSLWIAMIFAPLAFASYTVPFDIPGFGHKKWWENLLENAFLAPIFIFFLYIIVLFLDILGSGLTYNDSSSLMQELMKVIIPFAIIIVLLMKAKKLAVEYSGEMGSAMSKVGALAGGLALGAVTGGAALAGRATLGRAGSAIANSEWAKKREAEGKFGGATIRNIGKFAGKGSFDVKGIKVAGQSLESTGLKGLNTFGAPKVGGFEKIRADKVEKRQKRAKELEVGEDESLKQDVRKAEINLNQIKNDPGRQNDLVKLRGGDQSAPVGSLASKGVGALEKAVTNAEKDLADAERELKDVIAQFGATSTQAVTARATQAGKITDRNIARANLDARQAAISAAEGPIKAAEDRLKLAENTVISENKNRRQSYANTNQGAWSQTVNFVLSGGQHSFEGEREASNKILAGIQEEKK